MAALVMAPELTPGSATLAVLRCSTTRARAAAAAQGPTFLANPREKSAGLPGPTAWVPGGSNGCTPRFGSAKYDSLGRWSPALVTPRERNRARD